MKKRLSAEFFIKLVCVTLAAFLVFNFSLVSGAFSKFFDVMQPVFIGIVFALILAVPMDLLEYKLLRKLRKKKLRRALSLLISVVLFLGLIALIGYLAVPAVAESVKNIAGKVSEENTWTKLAESSPFLDFIIRNVRVVYLDFISRLQEFMPRILTIAQNVLKVIINIVIGIFIAIMLLANRDQLKSQLKKLIRRLFKKERVLQIAEVTNLALTKFSKYLGGQVIEAFILGTACYVFMVLLRLPYAALISMLIGVANLIPIVGAYAGGALSAILIFAVSPIKAIIFVVFILILQQVESFTTYPVIVGRYVGLNSFWIMVSITVFGGLFGFWGMFLGVPITAFLQDLIHGILNRPKDQITPVALLPPPAAK